MARCRLRGVRPAIERLDVHALHHPGYPLATDLDALSPQQIAHHAAARERVLQMQLIDPAHHRQIGRRYRTRPVVEGPLRLSFRIFACRVRESSCSRSIIALR